MIKYFYGDIGSGKTLSMIFEAEKIRNHFLKKNKKIMVFTNTDYKYKTNELWEIFNKELKLNNYELKKISISQLKNVALIGLIFIKNIHKSGD